MNRLVQICHDSKIVDGAYKLEATVQASSAKTAEVKLKQSIKKNAPHCIFQKDGKEIKSSRTAQAYMESN